VTVHAEPAHHRDAEVIEQARLCITAIVHLDEQESSVLLAHVALTHGVTVTALAAALVDIATGHAPLGRCGTPAHRAAADLILGPRPASD
jgi:hypothetical protein